MSKAKRAEKERMKIMEKRKNRRLFKLAAHQKDQLKKIQKCKKFIVQLNCGCCDAEVFFKDESALKKQFEDQGLTVSGVITDEIGNEVSGVDMFYGYRSPSSERRSLEYLVEQIIRKKGL